MGPGGTRPFKTFLCFLLILGPDPHVSGVPPGDRGRGTAGSGRYPGVYSLYYLWRIVGVLEPEGRSIPVSTFTKTGPGVPRVSWGVKTSGVVFRPRASLTPPSRSVGDVVVLGPDSKCRQWTTEVEPPVPCVSSFFPVTTFPDRDDLALSVFRGNVPAEGVLRTCKW